MALLLRPSGCVSDDAAPFRGGRVRSRQRLVTAGSSPSLARSPLSRWLTIFFPLLCAAGFAQAAYLGAQPLWLLGVPPALALTLALWRQWPGAPIYGALWFAGCAVERLVRLFQEGGALHAIVGVGFGWWALQVWREWGPRPSAPAAESSSKARTNVPRHLIALLAEAPAADEAWVRAAFQRALPEVPAHVHRMSNGFFTIQWESGAMALRLLAGAAPEEGALAHSSAQEQALRSAVRRHRAALGVVPLVRENGGDLRSIEAVIGRFLAELIGRGCLALSSSDGQRMVPFDLDLPLVLRSGEPWRVFDLEAEMPAVAAAREAELAAAASRARERFPVLAEAFARRSEAPRCGPFWVKAPFAEGAELEHLWIRVEALEGDAILGQVASEPRHAKRLAYGEPVEVERERISDWMFLRGDEPVGFFGSRIPLRDQKGKPNK
jgi:uncharacterized protein YegJ (DUF2314 family)